MKTDPNEPSALQQDNKPKTESMFISALKHFGVGAITGSAIAFATILLAQFYGLGSYWFGGAVFLLPFAVIGALIFGLPAGGVGGLILGMILKRRWAAILGGTIPAMFLSPVIFFVFSQCAFLGGC